MTIIVVGAGLAGGTAVTELRDQGYDGRLILIGSESHPPYERPPLSKGYLLGNDPIDDALVHEESWYAEHDVDFRPSTTVTAIDPAAHQVTAPASTASDQPACTYLVSSVCPRLRTSASSAWAEREIFCSRRPPITIGTTASGIPTSV